MDFDDISGDIAFGYNVEDFGTVLKIVDKYVSRKPFENRSLADIANQTGDSFAFEGFYKNE